MDFHGLLYAAHKNEVSKEKRPGRYYPSTFAPPKKEERSSKGLSVNVQKFLARKEEEEKRRKVEEERKREALFQLRNQDNKAKKRVQVMLKRTKSYNKSVIEDAIDDVNTADTVNGPQQCDEDDYGYVSQEASALYSKMMEKYGSVAPEDHKSHKNKKVSRDLLTTKDRVKLALQRQEEEEMGPHKRKRKKKNEDEKEDGHEPEEDSRRSPETSQSREPERREKEEKAKARRPAAPPPLGFSELLKMAEKKQYEPPPLEAKLKEVKRLQQQKEPERLMTKKEKLEYERTRDKRKDPGSSGDSKKNDQHRPTSSSVSEGSRTDHDREKARVKDKQRLQKETEKQREEEKRKQLKEQRAREEERAKRQREAERDQERERLKEKERKKEQERDLVRRREEERIRLREQERGRQERILQEEEERKREDDKVRQREKERMIEQEKMRLRVEERRKEQEMIRQRQQERRRQERILQEEEERKREDDKVRQREEERRKEQEKIHLRVEERRKEQEMIRQRQQERRSRVMQQRRIPPEMDEYGHRSKPTEQLKSTKRENGSTHSSGIPSKYPHDKATPSKSTERDGKKNSEKKVRISDLFGDRDSASPERHSVKSDKPKPPLHRPPERIKISGASTSVDDLFGDAVTIRTKTKPVPNNSNKQNPPLKPSEKTLSSSKSPKVTQDDLRKSKAPSLGDRKRPVESNGRPIPEKRPKQDDSRPSDRRGPLQNGTRPSAGPSSRPPMKPKEFPPKDLKSRQFPPPDVRSRQFPPPDVRSRQFPPSDVERNRAAAKRRMAYERADSEDSSEEDEEEEYDSELDDFIDDGPEEGEDYSKYIRDIFGYDKSRYSNFDDDDECMESNFAQVMCEEKRSARIGLMEDIEDMKKEHMEKRLKAMKKMKGKP